jgi:hypothetical protein
MSGDNCCKSYCLYILFVCFQNECAKAIICALRNRNKNTIGHSRLHQGFAQLRKRYNGYPYVRLRLGSHIHH